ncbi:MAG: PDC sensor domain-containing protein [Pseudomonadota bacterium]
MSTMSYISAIERYHEYGDSIRELLASIVTGIARKRLLHDDAELSLILQSLIKHYPFIDMAFTLTPDGEQDSGNVMNAGGRVKILDGKGKDRSQRPYFLLAKDTRQAVVTDPYFSNASGNICLSAATCIRDNDGVILGYVVLDINLIHAIEYLMGDTARRRFQSVFKVIYITIVVGLLGVLVSLLYLAFSEFLTALDNGKMGHYAPFSIIIYLTLALAIFDLGKTTLEEEVLMHKDIFRHSSTRRTITRFIAAILIAVSIESLLLIFKSALGDAKLLVEAAWMMLAAVGLLIGLGVYVFLGARAEVLLKQSWKK